MLSCIDQARQRLRIAGWSRSKNPKMRIPADCKICVIEAGDKVKYVDLGPFLQGGVLNWQVGVVAGYRVCNQDMLVTCGWVLVERNRYERARDRRLGRFIAVPCELAKVVLKADEIQRG